MGVIYVLVSRRGSGKDVELVADSVAPGREGNFGDISRRILQRIPPDSEEKKLTYVFDHHNFNIRIVKDLYFLAMADEAYGQARPFLLLKEVIDAFFLQCTGEDKSDSAAVKQFQTWLANKVKALADDDELRPNLNQRIDEATAAARLAAAASVPASSSSSNISSGPASSNNSSSAFNPEKARLVRQEIDDVKNIMMTNIEGAMARGDAIERLVDRSDELNMHSDQFKRTSTYLRRQQCLADLKMKAIIGGAIMFGLYIILASFCGLSLSNC